MIQHIDDIVNDTLPKLYHGSMYKQNELMPGYKRSGKLVEWDKIENNTWLYATTEKQLAIGLGLVSAWEKTFEVNYASIDVKTKALYVEFEKEIDRQALFEVPLFVYTIAFKTIDNWKRVGNPYNNIESEYKTKNTITDAIIEVEQINIKKFLSGFKIGISIKPVQ